MKRRDLIKRLTDAGWWHDKTRTGDHDIYRHDNRPKGQPNMVQVPRHREINKITADKILRDAGLL